MFNHIGYFIKALKRIAFFKTQYPPKTILKELFLFPFDYYLQSGKSNSIRNLTVIVTNRCNFRCQWCFYKKELDNKQDLDIELYNRLIDDTAENRPAVVLSGGEPFANKDIMKYVKIAKEHNLPASIFTNGVLLSEERTSQLIDYGLDYLCISIIGPEKIHNRISRTNSYGRLIDNLEYLKRIKRKNTKLIINVTLFKEMLDNFDYIKGLVSEYNIYAVRFQHLNFLRAAEFTKHAEVFKKLFQHDAELLQNVETRGFNRSEVEKINSFIEKTGCIKQEAPALSRTEIDNWYLDSQFKTQRKCIYPWRGAQIGADGAVYPCYKIHYPLGNLHEKQFHEIWNNENYMKFRHYLQRSLFPGCARCCKL